jgi:hypothetical protein
MTRYHEEQRFHGGIFGVLIAVILFEGIVTLIAVPSVRPEQAPLLLIGPAVVALITILFTLSHLDVDVTDDAVTIAFRYLWPARRIALKDIVGLEVKRYRPLVDYGGWGVRLGPAGWAFSTGGNVGVKLRLRTGLPVLIGTSRPQELEAAIRAGMVGSTSSA